MAERENYVDFTVPYYDLVGTTILMRRPDSSTSLFEFMRVLEWPVWLCIVAAYFFTSVLLWLFDRFRFGQLRRPHFYHYTVRTRTLITKKSTATIQRNASLHSRNACGSA